VWGRNSTGKAGKANGFKSSFVRIACRLGFMREEQAREADTLVETKEHGETKDLIVSAGLLTVEQAEEVVRVRVDEELEARLEMKFGEAHEAITGSFAATRQLAELLAKKA
jgi:hypothetical protein